MKVFAVLAAVCISACVAAPNAYGSYTATESPIVIRVEQQAPAPVVRQSYEQPAVRQSYEQPAIRQSYEQPAIRQSYEQPAVRQSYEQPASYGQQPLRNQVPIMKYELNNQNNGNFQVSTLGGDQTSINMEGTLKNVAGPESNGPVTVMKGSYSYTGPDNQVYTVTYTANENGFMPMGSHLPTPHPEIQAALRMMGAGAD